MHKRKRDARSKQREERHACGGVAALHGHACGPLSTCTHACMQQARGRPPARTSRLA